MKLKSLKNRFALGFSLFIITCSFFQQKETQPHSLNYEFVKQHTKSLIDELHQSSGYADALNVINLQKLKVSYFKIRNLYKEIECFLEYQFPVDVKYYINGSLVKKASSEYGKTVFEPHGFQVIEELLFSGDSIDLSKLKNEYLFLRQAFEAYSKKIELGFINDSQTVEALQFEFIRLMSLSLNGYDATYTKTAIEESISVLKGSEAVLNNLKKKYSNSSYPTKVHQILVDSIHKAIAYCKEHKDYVTFNRLYFITRYLNPIYKLLTELHQSSLFPYMEKNDAVDLRYKKQFDLESFNLNYFSGKEQDTTHTYQQKELGKLLFFDPALSGNNERACASCHKPDLGFTDGLTKALAFETKHDLSRNTPTLLNGVYQKNFFYDGRARQLVEQANEVLHNAKEMNINAKELISKLKQSDDYMALFRKAYAGTADTAITYYGILKAIKMYEQTLVSHNSRFDKYIRGDYAQLNTEEIHGYNLFAGKALCGSCHFYPLFNGLVPPLYNDTEYEVIGVPKDKNSNYIDEDEGRNSITKLYIHHYAFKTPTVRNSTLTAPYMHNGAYKTLEEVIEFYNKGGGAGLGIAIDYQTLPFDSLQLTKQEIKAIKAFMLSLTDTVGLTKKPKTLPRFKNELLNNRVIGGIY